MPNFHRNTNRNTINNDFFEQRFRNGELDESDFTLFYRRELDKIRNSYNSYYYTSIIRCFNFIVQYTRTEADRFDCLVDLIILYVNEYGGYDISSVLDYLFGQLNQLAGKDKSEAIEIIFINCFHSNNFRMLLRAVILSYFGKDKEISDYLLSLMEKGGFLKTSDKKEGCRYMSEALQRSGEGATSLYFDRLVKIYPEFLRDYLTSLYRNNDYEKIYEYRDQIHPKSRQEMDMMVDTYLYMKDIKSAQSWILKRFYASPNQVTLKSVLENLDEDTIQSESERIMSVARKNSELWYYATNRMGDMEEVLRYVESNTIPLDRRVQMLSHFYIDLSLIYHSRVFADLVSITERIILDNSYYLDYDSFHSVIFTLCKDRKGVEYVEQLRDKLSRTRRKMLVDIIDTVKKEVEYVYN